MGKRSSSLLAINKDQNICKLSHVESFLCVEEECKRKVNNNIPFQNMYGNYGSRSIFCLFSTIWVHLFYRKIMLARNQLTSDLFIVNEVIFYFESSIEIEWSIIIEVQSGIVQVSHTKDVLSQCFGRIFHVISKFQSV